MKFSKAEFRANAKRKKKSMKENKFRRLINLPIKLSQDLFFLFFCAQPSHAAHKDQNVLYHLEGVCLCACVCVCVQ